MARIQRFVRSDNWSGSAQPTEVHCAWKVFDTGSSRWLQLDTFGSKARMHPGKQSQTLQLDRSAAAALVRILEAAFPGITSGLS